MIINFLRKIRSELLEEKIALEAKQNIVQFNLDENVKFVQKLKNEEEKTFDAFSPRRQNEELRDNISQLEDEQQKIFKLNEKMKIDLNNINSRLAEIDLALEDAKKQKIELAKASRSEKKSLESDKDMYELFAISIPGILHKAEFSMKLSEIDPNRSKMELASAIKNLKEIMKLFSEIGEDKNEYDKINDRR